MADKESLAYYISEIRHFEAHMKEIEKFIREHAKKERWNTCVEALRCLKGIEGISAFAIVVEAQVFSRFPTASAFSSWLGPVPSEHSSGESKRRGSITKAKQQFLLRRMRECLTYYDS